MSFNHFFVAVRFVFVAGTIRGKNLMEGNDGAKIERALNIPFGRLAFLNSNGSGNSDKGRENECVPQAVKETTTAPQLSNEKETKKKEKWGESRFPNKKISQDKTILVRQLKRNTSGANKK